MISHIYGPKKGAALTTYVSLGAAAGGIQIAPTIAAGDFKVSKDGGAIANPNTLPAEAPASSGLVAVVLDATEMNADVVVVRWIDAAGAEWKDGVLIIHTRTVTVDELVRSTTPANALDVAATGEAGVDLTNVKLPASPTTLTNVTIPLVAQVTSVAGLDGGAIDETAIQNGALHASHFDADFYQGIWDALTSALVTAGSIGAFVVDNVTLLVNRLGGFAGSGVRTVKGYLEAVASSAATKPTEFGNFDGATDSLEKIGEQTPSIAGMVTSLSNLTSALAAAAATRSFAKIDYVPDDDASRDEYTAVWYEDGLAVAPASLLIQVTKRDGSALIASTAMTRIGSTNIYVYNAAGGERAAVGDAFEVKLTAGAVSFHDLKSRLS